MGILRPRTFLVWSRRRGCAWQEGEKAKLPVSAEVVARWCTGSLVFYYDTKLVTNNLGVAYNIRSSPFTDVVTSAHRRPRVFTQTPAPPTTVSYWHVRASLEALRQYHNSELITDRYSGYRDWSRHLAGTHSFRRLSFNYTFEYVTELLTAWASSNG